MRFKCKALKNYFLFFHIYLSSKVETCLGIPVQLRATGSSAEITAGPKSNPRWASGGYSVHFRKPFWNSHSISVTEFAGRVRRNSRWFGRCRSSPGLKYSFCGISFQIEIDALSTDGSINFKRPITDGDWFVFGITKCQCMEEYATIPRHQFQKHNVYIIAVIVVVDSSHQFSFSLSMTCQ